jgi:phage terminase large subunit
MRKDVRISKVFRKNFAAKSKVVVNEGGTRSGKTYSILQLLLFTKAYKVKGEVFTIVRKTLSTLRGTSMRDFFEILKAHDLYEQKKHNKTENTYEFRGNLFEFIGMDNPEKKRGAKRNCLFVNEANELSLEDWIQLSIRTGGQIFLDYNPSISADHWINEVVKVRPDCEVIHSTYLDNLEFLPAEVVREIENLKNVDPAYWKIYGLGEPAEITGLVFTNWREVEKFPHYLELDWQGFGMDFGFEHDPTALIRVGKKGDDLYLEEKIYDRGLLGSDLIEIMRGFGMKWSDEVISDRKPELIYELRRAGFNLRGAYKPPGSILAGIDIMKRFRLNVVRGNGNLVRELKNYKWREDRFGKKLNEPVDAFNHGIDAIRYVVMDREMIGKRRMRLGKAWL